MEKEVLGASTNGLRKSPEAGSKQCPITGIMLSYGRCSSSVTPEPFPALFSPFTAFSLHPSLVEALLGKSPLRLIVSRRWHDLNSFTDLLECGHESWQFADFVWEDGHPITLQPTAKRRRCQECAALLLGQKKAVKSVRLYPDDRERVA
jgi:hypothetical protein